MRVLALALLFAGPAFADDKSPPKPRKGPNDPSAGVIVDAKGNKSKNYAFTGLDIDGKLKTPQLLYFLNRMKSEFDTTTPDKRSFLRELEQSPSEM